MDPADLGATELTALFAKGALSPLEALEAAWARIAAAEPGAECDRHARSGGRPLGGAGQHGALGEARAAEPPRRRAGHDQGQPARPGLASDLGLAALRRLRSGRRRVAGRAAARRRRRHPRQDQCPRADPAGLHRQPAVRPDAQPLGSGADARRVERRRRRLGGERHGGAGARPPTAAARSGGPPRTPASSG